MRTWIWVISCVMRPIGGMPAAYRMSYCVYQKRESIVYRWYIVEESAASEKGVIFESEWAWRLLQPQLEESRMISADCYPISGALEALIEHTKSWNNSEMNLMWLCQRQSPSLRSFQVATYANNDDMWVPNFSIQGGGPACHIHRKENLTAQQENWCR